MRDSTTVWSRARRAFTTLVAAAVASATAAVVVAPPDADGVGDRDASSASTSASPSGRQARSLADTIGARPNVRQMITVSARSWDSHHANLKAWQRRTDGAWRLAGGPFRVVIGYGGWVVAADRVQGTGTTPAGRFTMPYAFGRYADPGSQLQYRRVDGDDWWPYEPRDPATYNVYQFHKAAKTQWRSSKAEHLDSYTRQYGYAMVIGFNLPSKVHYSAHRRQWVADNRAYKHRGGGIFLHIRGDGYTAGCVAMSPSEMRWLVRWVRPRAHARIVMGPHDYIVEL